jgi:hypothetical protein
MMQRYVILTEAPIGRSIATRDVTNALTPEEQKAISDICFAVAARDPSIWLLNLRFELTAEYDVATFLDSAKSQSSAPGGQKEGKKP